MESRHSFEELARQEAATGSGSPPPPNFGFLWYFKYLDQYEKVVMSHKNKVNLLFIARIFQLQPDTIELDGVFYESDSGGVTLGNVCGGGGLNMHDTSVAFHQSDSKGVTLSDFKQSLLDIEGAIVVSGDPIKQDRTWYSFLSKLVNDFDFDFFHGKKKLM